MRDAGDQHPDALAQEHGDAVDAQHAHAEKAPEQQPVPLPAEEEDRAAREDPLAELQDGTRGRGIPGQPIASPGAQQVAAGEVHRRVDQAPHDQRPHRRAPPGPDDHHHQSERAADDLEDHQRPQPDPTPERVDGRRREAGEQRRDAADRHQRYELRLAVQRGGGPGEHQREQRQQGSAHDLDGPDGVEETSLVAAWALDDARLEAHVGEQLQSDQEHADQRREAEGLREQQAAQHEVPEQAQRLAGHVARELDGRAAQGQLLQGGTALGGRADLLHRRLQRERNERFNRLPSRRSSTRAVSSASSAGISTLPFHHSPGRARNTVSWATAVPPGISRV